MPARNSGLEIAEFGHEFVVFDPRCGQVHLLSELTAVVFDACDGHTPVAELCRELVEAGVAGPQAAEEMLVGVLEEFCALGLLEGTEWIPPPPCVGCGGDAASPGKRSRQR
jgi:PqqD family protein of HPr-rel-A system